MFGELRQRTCYPKRVVLLVTLGMRHSLHMRFFHVWRVLTLCFQRKLYDWLGRSGSIPVLVLPSGGMAVRHRKGVTAERFLVQSTMAIGIPLPPRTPNEQVFLATRIPDDGDVLQVPLQRDYDEHIVPSRAELQNTHSTLWLTTIFTTEDHLITMNRLGRLHRSWILQIDIRGNTPSGIDQLAQTAIIIAAVQIIGPSGNHSFPGVHAGNLDA
ncbi:hypothetical protein CLF_105697 [Clonorchis sinensis]|uniref:Uncharacterized protein n=1 Tax=Clonorchis sinensis TaxID=79923 RepID=G7YE05_CLOSI|nr:hypothetical protein CLF_105697 [Clonorchis sinensis]